jgi:hypothetical protein
MSQLNNNVSSNDLKVKELLKIITDNHSILYIPLTVYSKEFKSG